MSSPLNFHSIPSAETSPHIKKALLYNLLVYFTLMVVLLSRSLNKALSFLRFNFLSSSFPSLLFPSLILPFPSSPIFFLSYDSVYFPSHSFPFLSCLFHFLFFLFLPLDSLPILLLSHASLSFFSPPFYLFLVHSLSTYFYLLSYFLPTLPFLTQSFLPHSLGSAQGRERECSWERNKNRREERGKEEGVGWILGCVLQESRFTLVW